MQAPAGFSSKPLSYDKATGIYTWFRFEELTGEISTCTSQDPTAILEQNKRESFDAKGTFTRKGKWGTKAASIPVGLIHKWREEEGIDVYDPAHADAVKKKLNSSEYAYLRVGNFRM